MQVEPFRIDIPQASLDDLGRRLAATRWPGGVEGDGWRFGTDTGYLRGLVEHWQHHYDWRAHERAMNAWLHFRAQVPGPGGVLVPVHFIHAKGKGTNPLPLVLTHGWPWTFWDLKDVLGPLTDPAAYGGDPADSFDVVVPSLPGYCFSTPLPVPFLTTAQVADLWVELMHGLGYGADGGRFCAQGGDWGAIVTIEMGHAHADALHGIAVTMPSFPGASRGPHAPEDLLPGEEDYAERTARRVKTAASHVAVMGTDPQTLAHALHDSPVGLLSWLVERRRAWSDCETADGSRDVERRFSKDDLCTLASLYWHTGCFWSTERMYYGRVNVPWTPRHDRTPTIEAPTAMAVFPGDLIFVPRRVAERVANIRRWEVMPSGGHFAPAEEPALVVREVREFFRAFR